MFSSTRIVAHIIHAALESVCWENDCVLTEILRLIENFNDAELLQVLDIILETDLFFVFYMVILYTHKKCLKMR